VNKKEFHNTQKKFQKSEKIPSTQNFNSQVRNNELDDFYRHARISNKHHAYAMLAKAIESNSSTTK
jgi:hypothetical protein